MLRLKIQLVFLGITAIIFSNFNQVNGQDLHGKFTLQVGAMFRSTELGTYSIPNGGIQDSRYPLILERNLQGFGIKGKVTYQLLSRISLTYSNNIRYDKVGYVNAIDKENNPEEKFFVDLSMGLNLYPLKKDKREFYLIGEACVINLGANAYFYQNGNRVTHSLSFLTFNVGFGVKIWELNWENMIGFTGRDNPYYSYHGFSFITSSISYTIFGSN